MRRRLINKSSTYSMVFNEHLCHAGSREQWGIRKALLLRKKDKPVWCVSARKRTGVLREGNWGPGSDLGGAWFRKAFSKELIKKKAQIKNRVRGKKEYRQILVP